MGRGRGLSQNLLILRTVNGSHGSSHKNLHWKWQVTGLIHCRQKLKPYIDVRSTIDRLVCLGRKLKEEETWALIYLLYERLRSEILKKKEKKQRQGGGEKDKLRRDPTCLCFLLCGDEIEMRSFIFFKQKNSTATHLFSFYFDMFFSFEKRVLDFWILATISNFSIYSFFFFNEINFTFWRPLNVYI